MSKVIKSLNALMISKVRIKALKYFVFNPDVPIHLRGAVRELGEEINAVRRELNRLEEINFLNSEARGNKKYFSLNTKHPLLPEITSMLNKAFGLGGSIVKSGSKLGDVKFAVLTDNYVRGISDDKNKIDLVAVGDINMDVLGTLVDEAEKKMKREIHYAVLKESEFILRKKRRDVFIMEFLMSEKVFLIGNSEDLQ